MLATEIQNMHRLEIREQRFRLQQRASKLEEGPEKDEIDGQITAIQQACPHASEEEGAAGWRCRDCDLSRAPEPVEEDPPTKEEGAAPTATA